MKTLPFLFATALVFVSLSTIAQDKLIGSYDAIASVDFTTALRTWDGFGVNYVEMAQTYDYKNSPQDYGGFGILDEKERQEIVELIFGRDGLKPGLAKMFLDPLHQQQPEGKFDHETMTRWMRYFIQEGIKKTNERGDTLSIITTLYGPPGWAKVQKDIRGRDLDPARFDDLARYITHWVDYLRKKDFPVNYVSIHNESESQYAWRERDGTLDFHGIDYDAYWTPEQVAEFMGILSRQLTQQGYGFVGVAPGETQNWQNLHSMNYDWAIVQNKKALDALGLITSHSFGSPNVVVSSSVDLFRSRRPDLHAWVTSSSWGRYDMHLAQQIYLNIYKAKVNGIIPWAVIQQPSIWKNTDPNPASPIQVTDDGRYEVTSTYYLYKQFTRAGQPGMNVCPTSTTSYSGIELVAFGKADTENPDAFIVINQNDWGGSKKTAIRVEGSGTVFKAIRTARQYAYTNTQLYEEIGEFEVKDGYIIYDAPVHSVTTFYNVR